MWIFLNITSETEDEDKLNLFVSPKFIKIFATLMSTSNIEKQIKSIICQICANLVIDGEKINGIHNFVSVMTDRIYSFIKLEECIDIIIGNALYYFNTLVDNRSLISKETVYFI